MKKLIRIGWLSVVMAAAACGTDDPGAGEEDPQFLDRDGDGFTPADGDCDDDNRFVYPDAPEPCDGIDNDCDGQVDEDWDQDGDGWTTCAGDCRDHDPTSYPYANELIDGVDNDCDGIIDNNTDAYDDDGDGWSEDQGDCDDNNPLINPGAVEVQLDEDGNPEGFDNDCDGIVDEAIEPCAHINNKNDPMAYVNAINACHYVTSASWDKNKGIDARSRGIFEKYGDTYAPKVGERFAVLSTGIAGDKSHPGWVAVQSGTSFSNSVPHPDPQPGNMCGEDPASVNDYTEVKMQLVVPTNANAFAFDFNFMSAEFPEYVCTSFDDTFVALLESQAFTGNVSFDAMGNRVSINVGFFNICQTSLGATCVGDADIVGTGYEGSIGGGTGWLTTTAPVVPGEKITLTFAIFDEGDRILDSAVLIDNFRWEIEPVDGPITVPKTESRPSRLIVADRLKN